MARLTAVSDSYLSQIERGLFKPSAEVIKRVADALGVSVSALYARVGLLDRDDPDVDAAPDAAGEGAGRAAGVDVEDAIRRTSRLTSGQKDALLGVYHAFLRENEPADKPHARARKPPAKPS